MTKKFCVLFKRSPPTPRSHYRPPPRCYSDCYDDDDFQSDLVEKDIPPVHSIIQPVATPSTTADDLSQYAHILELPTEIRRRFVQLQHNATQLKIDRTTAPNIFANMLPPVWSANKWDVLLSNKIVLLSNKVEKLIIEDMESAQALAQAIEDYRFSRADIGGKNYPATDVFGNVKTISFGSQFTESLVNSTNNIRYLRALHTIGGTLKPTHICFAQPFNHPEEYLDLFDSVSALMNHGRLESLTAHGFWFDSDCIPSSLKTLNIIFSDCPLSTNSGNCDCYIKLRDALDSIIDMDCGEVDSELQKGKGVNLMNLPHVSPDMLTLQALVEMKIKSEGGFPVHNEDGKMIDLTKGFKASWEWFENKFKIISKGDAKPCVCCGMV